VTSTDLRTPLFGYAAEADNVSGDLILIVGAADQPAPAGFLPPTPTATGSSSGPSPTATPVPPTPTPTPSAAIVVNLVATEFQWSINGGDSRFVMHVGQTYELHISDGDPSVRTPHGFSGIPSLGISARALQAGSSPVVVTFTPRSGQTGNFFFSCNQPSCGSGHSDMVGSIQIMSYGQPRGSSFPLRAGPIPYGGSARNLFQAVASQRTEGEWSRCSID
jgi:hypothetical protein